MTKKEAKKWIKSKQPLVNVPNNLEFKQRLQWLSEGMLANHLSSTVNCEIDEQEIADYLTYKRLLNNEA